MKKRLIAGTCVLIFALFLAPMAGADAVVYPSNQTISLDGEVKTLHAYALKNEAGFLTNYVKIRDLAALLNFTLAQFNVTWDGEVNLSPGQSYRSPNGQEGKAPYDGEQPYIPSTVNTKISGSYHNMDAFVIYDSEGNGSTYYKLRDIAQALDFFVTWREGEGMLIDTSISYRE